MLDIMFLFVTKCNVLKCLVPLGLKLVKGNSFPHPFLHNHTQFFNITLYARTINDMIRVYCLWQVTLYIHIPFSQTYY